ncbi:MAG: Re/Si-specific NAD(P)(+) transhydrogenase subunit alpha [Candidatus Lambdaproteobacteria bacterium]|nr:Re/Si-specific NAD(P)(+) transhydrogenase subunit alpha [Candidatus Lambdaproteobacteria bacterium]
MKLGIPKESVRGETRVSVIPETVKRLVEKGFEVIVEDGAGAAALYTNQEYSAQGATIVPTHEAVLGTADLVLKVQPPLMGENGGPDELALMRAGSGIVSFLQPFSRADLVRSLAEKKIDGFSMELIPRISRAQNMDALSSQATVSGYKAVLLAADHLTRFFPMFMTAAGTIPPARVLVLGAGVAGLQAIATAKRLGAVVEAFDTRPVVKGEVESLGARFISIEISHEAAQDAGGYAKELSKDQHAKELELIASRLPRADVVISTANVPGQKAPVLITAAMARSMRPGAVIVDLAAENGGNCELTEPGQIAQKEGLTLIGLTNLPGLMPTHASQMYSKNVGNLLLHMAGKEGFKVDRADPITAGILVTYQGQVVHPALQPK